MHDTNGYIHSPWACIYEPSTLYIVRTVNAKLANYRCERSLYIRLQSIHVQLARVLWAAALVMSMRILFAAASSQLCLGHTCRESQCAPDQLGVNCRVHDKNHASWLWPVYLYYGASMNLPCALLLFEPPKLALCGLWPWFLQLTTRNNVIHLAGHEWAAPARNPCVYIIWFTLFIQENTCPGYLTKKNPISWNIYNGL